MGPLRRGIKKARDAGEDHFGALAPKAVRPRRRKEIPDYRGPSGLSVPEGEVFELGASG